MSKLRVLEFKSPDGAKAKSPVWMRTAMVRLDGQILLPAALFGAETQVILCAMIDGVPITSHKTHGYVPMDWAFRELTVPKVVADQEENIRKNIARAIEHAGSPC